MHSVSTLPHLYARSHAERWGVPRERFAAALERSLASRFRGSTPTEREVSRYLESLHLDDLALACACSAGTNEAWEHFIATHRPALYRAASAIAGERGRELADSLYGELFGLEERGGNRRSPLEYFLGRSSLATWVRAILAQRYIDTVRASRRTEPLDERVSDEATAVIDAESPDLDRTRLTRLLKRSFGAALDDLAPADRVRLSYYYRDRLTLAHIGRLEHTHEATVSRKLARSRRTLRADIERRLRTQHRLSAAAIERCFEYAGDGVDDPDDSPAPDPGARRPPRDVQGVRGSRATDKGRHP